MSLKIYLLRHGETTYSQTGGFCGSLDPELTDAGLEMAKAFANAYQSLAWEAIYVSPMKRTLATAKPLSEVTGLPLNIREGLKEIDFGQWESQTHEWVKNRYLDDYIKWMTEPAWNPPTGGETAVEIASRASIVISEIQSKFTQGNVLVVSHKATIRIILCELLGIDLGRYRDRIDIPAASLTLLKFDTHGPLLQRLGDRSFMSEELRNRAGT